MYTTEPEITVGHWTFSDQMYGMSGHFRFWLDIMSGQYFCIFYVFKTVIVWTNFLNVWSKLWLSSDIMSWHFSHLISCSDTIPLCWEGKIKTFQIQGEHCSNFKTSGTKQKSRRSKWFPCHETETTTHLINCCTIPLLLVTNWCTVLYPTISNIPPGVVDWCPC